MKLPNMSIKITTLTEAEHTKNICQKYGEVCEILIGKAKQDYLCDNSGDEIPQGTECAVVMTLPYKEHPNYAHQKAMMKDYIIA